MPDFLINRLVTHGADKMFDLVADVERYPEFLPFCQRQVVRSRETRGDIVTLTTDMTVAHLVFRETFRSRVTLDRANGRILIAAADGLVRRLHGRWDFLARNAGRCEVGFSLSYELASRTLALLMGPVFNAAFSGIVQAFEQRADAIHGRTRHAPAAPSVQPALPHIGDHRAPVPLATSGPE